MKRLFFFRVRVCVMCIKCHLNEAKSSECRVILSRSWVSQGRTPVYSLLTWNVPVKCDSRKRREFVLTMSVIYGPETVADSAIQWGAVGEYVPLRLK